MIVKQNKKSSPQTPGSQLKAFVEKKIKMQKNIIAIPHPHRFNSCRKFYLKVGKVCRKDMKAEKVQIFAC